MMNPEPIATALRGAENCRPWPPPPNWLKKSRNGSGRSSGLTPAVPETCSSTVTVTTAGLTRSTRSAKLNGAPFSSMRGVLARAGCDASCAATFEAGTRTGACCCACVAAPSPTTRIAAAEQAASNLGPCTLVEPGLLLSVDHCCSSSRPRFPRTAAHKVWNQVVRHLDYAVSVHNINRVTGPQKSDAHLTNVMAGASFCLVLSARFFARPRNHHCDHTTAYDQDQKRAEPQ